MQSWPDQVAARVNCFNLHDWLPGLAQWLDQEMEALLPIEARKEWVVQCPKHGVTLAFSHPHAGYSEIADISRWVLVSARFQSVMGLPFGLDAELETLETARRKFGCQTEITPTRVSFFLSDERVVELSFRDGTGIQNVWVVRLGRTLSWKSIETCTSL
jgi:hypothetical protein